jgi:WD40 repeat protein
VHVKLILIPYYYIRWIYNTSYACVNVLQAYSLWISSLININKNSLACASGDKTIKLWTDFKCYQTLTGHTDWVYSIIYMEKEDRLISGSCDCTIRIWEFEHYQCVCKFGTNHVVWSLLLLPGGYFASACWDRSSCIWDIKNYKCMKSLK